MRLFCFLTIAWFCTVGFTVSFARLPTAKEVADIWNNGTDPKRLAKNRNRAEKLACRGVDCDPGRQCALDDAGQITCICLKKCSKNDRPICASNGQTFRNKCEMHRYACTQGINLSKNHSNPCTETETNKPVVKKVRPIVCFEKDRDTIHKKIIEWIDSLIDTLSMDRLQVIRDKLTIFDRDFDGSLDSSEFQVFIETNDAVSIVENITDPEEQDALLIRGMCVDALIEGADVDHDWKLNLGELTTCLTTNYTPAKRTCSLDENEFDDGSAVKKKCNVCVCACGNWVCTAHVCGSSNHSVSSHPTSIEEEEDLFMTQEEWEAKLKALAEGAIDVAKQYGTPILDKIYKETSIQISDVGNIPGVPMLGVGDIPAVPEILYVPSPPVFTDEEQGEKVADMWDRLVAGPNIPDALDHIKEIAKTPLQLKKISRLGRSA